MKVVFVDIDGTLTRGRFSSEVQFFTFMLCRGRIGPRQLASYLRQLLPAWRMQGIHLLKINKGYFAGLRTETVQQDALDWLHTREQNFWRKQTLKRVRSHQREGDYLVLLSGTPQPVAAAFGALLGVNESFGAGIPSREGYYTGGQVSIHPFAGGKCAVASNLLDSLTAQTSDAIAYADSQHDIELLSMVGRAIAVAPDRKLSKCAQRKGWEIL